MIFINKRVNAVIGLKMRNILSNMSLMLNPILALVNVFVLRKVMQNFTQIDSTFNVDAFLLSLGLIINIVSGGLLISSTAIAEEKEKNTLRVLMTSSVKSGEYLLGSMIPTFLIIMIVNLLLIPASGISYSTINLSSYLFITITTTLISIIFGFFIGIISKDQAQSSVMSTPVLLLFTMLPQFRLFNETVNRISNVTFSGIIANYIDGVFSEGFYNFSRHDITILVIWLTISFLLFIMAYKKFGVDSD